MNGHIVRAIVAKDFREMGRSRYWLALGPVSLAVAIATFWMLPARNPFEAVNVGLSPPSLTHAANAALELARLGQFGEQVASLARGVRIVPFADEDSLREVLSGEVRPKGTEFVTAGIVFPAGFVESVRTGERTVVSVYSKAGLSEGLDDAVAGCIREVACGLRAATEGTHPVQALPFALPDLRTVTLGEDRGGVLIPQGKLIRPLFSAVILLFGALVISGLLAAEIEHRTVTAVLVTPAGAGDFLAAKGIVGALVCSGQVLVYLLGTWRFEENWLPVILLVLLGGVMMSAVGIIAGAAGKGYMDTILRCSLLAIPLALPIFTMMVPGDPSLLTRAVPSYGFIRGLFYASALDRGWSDVAPYICNALAWDVVLFGVGLFMLRRRVKRA